MECLDAFEKYLHLEERSYATLIDAGMIHVQFETIHPFLDGNGRIGRLLITFFLLMMGNLRQPSLYLSLYFKNNREEYYRRLGAVRATGDWEGWLDYFLYGVAETANQVVATTQTISALFKSDNDKIVVLKRAGITARQAHERLQKIAISNANNMAAALNVSVPTARLALNNLKELGIVRDIQGSGKERLYIYTSLVDLLEQGTAPIALAKGVG